MTDVAKSYWRKLVESWHEARKDQMIPEYRQEHDRHHNQRYYR